MRLRILADDLTGALDSAAAFASHGDVPVWLGKAPMHHDSQRAVQALSTGTRDLSHAAAERAVCDTLDWFAPRKDEPGIAFKKVDSLLRGNTLFEVAALARSGAFNGVVFAPAFPAQGRFTRDGRHWVGPPHRPQAAALQICADALVRACAVHGLDAVTGPADMPMPRQPTQVWIPDVVTDADLQAVADASQQPEAGRWLWCGSAGLAAVLAHTWRIHPTEVELAQADLPAPPELSVTASRHPVLREQMSRLAAARRRDQGSPADSVRLIDLAPAESLPPEQAAHHLAAACSDLVRHRPRPRTAVVIGGDTLLALCQASGATHLQASKSIRPGWGRARIEGGRWHGTTLLSRSGAFGGPDDIAALLAQLAPHTFKESIT